jgi:hypothetical protein
MKHHICKQVVEHVKFVVRAEDFLLDPDIIKMSLYQTCSGSEVDCVKCKQNMYQGRDCAWDQ